MTYNRPVDYARDNCLNVFKERELTPNLNESTESPIQRRLSIHQTIYDELTGGGTIDSLSEEIASYIKESKVVN